MPVAVPTSEGLGSSPWWKPKLLPGDRQLEPRALKLRCEERPPQAPNLPLHADAPRPEQARRLGLACSAASTGRRRGLMRQRWSEQPAAHLAKTLPPAKRPETEPKLLAPWPRSQKDKPVPTRTAAAVRGRGAFGLRRRLPPSGDGEHPSAATCCLTFELRRERRCGAWPARRMIRTTGSRAKCHAGASRLQRRVRPHRVDALRKCRMEAVCPAQRPATVAREPGAPNV